MPDSTVVQRLEKYRVRITEFDQAKQKDLIADKALKKQLTHCKGGAPFE
jgi:hypothetical protein